MQKSSETYVVGGTFWLHRAEHRFIGEERIALLEKIGECGSISGAARAVGISYKTAWDSVTLMNNQAQAPLVDRMIGGKGGGGASLTSAGTEMVRNYRIMEEEHRRFLDNLSARIGEADSLYNFIRRISMKLSARNVFSGTVAKVTRGAVNAEVTLTLTGGSLLTAIVTNGSVENLGLKKGDTAYAIIKASSIIVGTDLHDARVSARNIFCGTVAKLVTGSVNSEVDIEIGGGNTLSAIITKESAEKLGLKVGSHACALFKASSVILGTD